MPFYNEQDKKFDVFFLSSIESKGGVFLTQTKDFGTFEQMSSSFQIGGTGSYDSAYSGMRTENMKLLTDFTCMPRKPFPTAKTAMFRAGHPRDKISIHRAN
jgi:hypothetical protein